MPKVTLESWLAELERTDLPQNRGGPGTPSCPCALTLALTMGDTWTPFVSTAKAIKILGGRDADDNQTNRYAALRQVYLWNDVDKLSFAQIAQRFRKEFPHLLEDPK